MKAANLVKEVLGGASLVFVIFLVISRLLADAVEALRIMP